MLLANAFPDNRTLAVIAIGLVLILAIPAGLILLMIKLWNRIRDSRH